MDQESRTAEIRIITITEDPSLLSETGQEPVPVVDQSNDDGDHVALCAAHFEERYGEEPDMSDGDWLTFQRGTCAQCGKNAITFRVTV
ncbi:hypothetical protein [Gordonia sihwensis]|uniref:hypothetical protein n=1 Tax=Gordonia sihwensis TaxID=173559 RepID=UPI0005EDAE74|nr:hypothetical protein [Gordonia sihwensis]KJR10532.1 hypothetical protein UG54_00615 [Gordonia sihwensis]